MKGKIVFWCKDDRTFIWIGTNLTLKFHEIKTGEKPKVPREIRTLGRVMLHVQNKIRGILTKIDKELSEYIKNGQIDLTIEPFEKGGEVIMNLEGTKEEIECWVSLRMRDRVAMKAIKGKVEIKAYSNV